MLDDCGILWYGLAHMVLRIERYNGTQTYYETVCGRSYTRTRDAPVELGLPTCLECYARMGRKFCSRCDTPLTDAQLPMDAQERCNDCAM